VAQQGTPDRPDRPDDALTEGDLEDVVGGVGGVVLNDPLEVSSGYPGDDVDTESSVPNESVYPVIPGPVTYT
jgi:hypothetical protein